MKQLHEEHDPPPANDLSALTQRFSPQVIDHWLHPRNLGRLVDADAHAGGPGPCGDSIWMWLKVRVDRDGRHIIRAARFVSDVCIGAVSCASRLTEMIQGMEINVAARITPEALIDSLGGLPEAERHCAALAVKTLQDTIRDYRRRQTEGWKTLYRPR
jgi:nitrogen fixation NifU-like protein